MGVLRARAHVAKASVHPREGTFEAQLPRSWTTSSTQTGNFYNDPAWQPVRSRPQSASAKVMANASIREGRLSSEAVGMHSGIRPMVRPRPASDVTVMLRNPAVRDGYVSSEPIGNHTGFQPRKTTEPSERTELPQTRKDRPRTAPIWTRTLRTSDAIGTHPRPVTPDVTDAAVMHFEAQFNHRFGESGHLGAVLSSKATAAAAEFQKRWVERARKMNELEAIVIDESENKVARNDGVLMERMDFDAVYSNAFAHKDTESALGVGFVPVIDMRRDGITRPKKINYGEMHRVQTAYGVRQPLPSRTTLGIGTGRGRSIDF